MSQELKAQRIAYRLSQAAESLEEANALFGVSLYRGAVNRAYYAMFYALMALSVYKETAFAKHSGLIGFFDREFVKTGIFSKEQSKVIHLAFDRRQSSDYGEIELVDKSEARQAIAEAQEFLIAVREYLMPNASL